MPRRPIRRWMAARVLALTGWKAVGPRPDVDRCVLIAAPHTSNWDFPLLLLFASRYELRIRWMGKHSLFRGPFAWIFRALGGIPVRRDRRENVVDAMARSLESEDEFALVVPAEGTRGRAEYWKSGFYHIARSAKVPIVMSYLDFEEKTAGFSAAFEPSGDIPKDMEQIRSFYEGRQGKFPAKFSRVRLREEEEAPGVTDDAEAR